MFTNVCYSMWQAYVGSTLKSTVMNETSLLARLTKEGRSNTHTHWWHLSVGDLILFWHLGYSEWFRAVTAKIYFVKKVKWQYPLSLESIMTHNSQYWSLWELLMHVLTQCIVFPHLSCSVCKNPLGRNCINNIIIVSIIFKSSIFSMDL